MLFQIINMVHIPLNINIQHYLIVKHRGGSYIFTNRKYKDINSDGILQVQWIETI